MTKLIYRNIFIILLFLISSVSFAQPLTGTKTVGGTTPDYATLSLAIDALNTNGAGTGGVVFNVAAGLTETIINKVITTTSGSVTSPITFVKSGVGANPLISSGVGTSTTVDAAIKIAGTDYITIDGIDIIDPSTNTTNTTRLEWGYAIVKGSATNGSQHVTIKNCTITLQKANTASKGIYSGNHIATATTQLVVTNFTGTNSYIDIYSNNITNTYNGIYMAGYNNQTYYDDSIRIGTYGQNIVTNFGGTSTACYGIYVQYFKYAEIMNDSISGGTSTSSDVSGINANVAVGSNVLIQNNIVQTFASSSISNIYGIYSSSGATGGNIVIDNNRVQNGTMSGSISQFYYIYTTSTANTIISNNIISGGAITTSQGSGYGIYLALAPTVRNVFNNQMLNTSYSVSIGTYYGIYLAAGTANIYNNTISGNTCNNHFYSIYSVTGGNIYNNTISTNSTTGSSAQHYGIYMAGGDANIYQNNIFSSNTTGSGVMQGIILAGAGGANYLVYKNKIYGLTSTNSSTVISGIVQSALNTSTIYNNLIGSMVPNSATTAANGTNGINVTSSTDGTVSNIYHNSIYLAATSTGGTNGILLSTTALARVNNNIIINVSANGTTTARAACAIKRTSASYGTYAISSNNNFLYVSAVSTTNRFIYYDGTSSFQTLPLYQTYAANRDQSSISGSANLLSVAGSSPLFMKPDTTLASLLESSGKILAGITGDYVSETSRSVYPKTGQINGGGTAPDIGAYELDMIPSDSTGPEIIYDLLTKSLITSYKDLSGVQINDPRGVNFAFGHAPRLYFKKSTNANTVASANNSGSDGWKYVESYSFTNPYTFTIDYSLLYATGTVSAGDVIQYFVVAEDNSILHNVRAKGATLNSNPISVALLAANFPASAINSYSIVASGMPSVITVGTPGGNYPNLTMSGGLFEAINNGLITNDVTVQIISDLPGETGAIALNKFAEDGFGSGTYRITIQPFQASVYTISGTVTTGGFIRLSDVARVTIDGSYSGIGRYLNINNHAMTGNNAVIHLVSSGPGGGCNGISIKNCNIWTDTSYSSGGVGIYVGSSVVGTGTGSAQGYDNKNITISNNAISEAYSGIVVNGIAPNYADSINIINNEIGSDSTNKFIGACGLYMRGVNRATISRNRIFNINNAYTFELDGISLQQDVYNVNLNANNINNIINTASGSSPVFGIYVRGNASSNLIFKNNIISKILGQGAASDITAGPVGIYLFGGSNYKILNNSICLSGDRQNNTVGSAYTACVYLKASLTQINISNNVFKNVMTSSNTVNVGTNFCIYSADNNATAFSRLNNNLYYAASATSGMVNALGYIGSTVRTDLNAWKSFTALDKNSMWGNPGYVADSIIQPNLNDSNIWYMNGRGFPSTDVATDLLGNPRSTLITSGACDIGAYEITPLVTPKVAIPSAAPAAGQTTYFLVALDTVAAITWAPSSTIPATMALRYYSGVNPPSPSTPKYFNAYWDVQANPSIGLTYNLKLYYKPEAMRSVENESSLVLAQKDQFTPWSPFTFGLTTIDSINKTIAVQNLYSLSVFTGTSSSNPLPVELSYFNGIKKGADVLLSWATAQEINSAVFIIERSYDLNSWSEIGKVYAAGYSKKMQTYNFVDRINNTGTIYYRLRMVDLDGKFENSKIVSLTQDIVISSQIEVFPNPFNKQLSISLNEAVDQNLKIEIMDINGKLISGQMANFIGGNSILDLENLCNLNPGIYLIAIEYNGVRHIKKVVKQ